MAYTSHESPPHSLSAADAADSEEHSESHEWAAFRIRPGMTRDDIDHVSALVANFPGTPDLAMANDSKSGFDLDAYTVQELVEIHKQQIIERFVKRFSKRKTDLNSSEERERDTAGARRWEAVFETLSDKGTGFELSLTSLTLSTEQRRGSQLKPRCLGFGCRVWVGIWQVQVSCGRR